MRTDQARKITDKAITKLLEELDRGKNKMIEANGESYCLKESRRGLKAVIG